MEKVENSINNIPSNTLLIIMKIFIAMNRQFLLIFTTVFLLGFASSGCQPNGNNNSTDVHNSMEEGVDTTHLNDADSLRTIPGNSGAADTAGGNK
jgi:hypothetical protein